MATVSKAKAREADFPIMLAYVKTGGRRAFFDQVKDGYEIQWGMNSDPVYSFKSLKAAQEFWHTEVIDPNGFKHCYCC